jgi:hypothetical protein
MKLSPEKHQQTVNWITKRAHACPTCRSKTFHISDEVLFMLAEPNITAQHIAFVPVRCIDCAHVMLFDPQEMGVL